MRTFMFLAVGLFAPAVAAAKTPLKIVCLGDSVTKAVRPGVKADETFCAVLEKKLHDTGTKATVINSGVGGHTTADGLARFDRDVLAHKPTHVVIMFGLNDCWIDDGKTAPRLTQEQYAANLKKMIDKLRADKIAIVLMTPNPVIAPKYPPARNAHLKKYVQEVRRLARTEKLPLIDVYAHIGELALEGVDLNTLFTDAQHPNPKAQALIAEWLFEELAPPRKE
jgi:acyl-CoA thioesterase-1